MGRQRYCFLLKLQRNALTLSYLSTNFSIFHTFLALLCSAQLIKQYQFAIAELYTTHNKDNRTYSNITFIKINFQKILIITLIDFASSLFMLNITVQIKEFF